MNRREFFKTTGAVALSVAVPLPIVARIADPVPTAPLLTGSTPAFLRGWPALEWMEAAGSISTEFLEEGRKRERTTRSRRSRR